MFDKRIFWSLALLLITQLSFAGGSTCITINTGNWSDASTWNCGGATLPADESEVTIEPGHTVTLDIDTPSIGNLIIEVGGDFSVAASANGLNLNISKHSGAVAIDLTEASIELFGDFIINADDRDIKLGSVIGEFDLTLNSSGETRFEGIIGNPSNFNNTGNLTALITDADGTTVFANTDGGANSANISVNGPRIFNDAVLLFSTTHIKGSGGPITFNGTVDTETSVSFRAFYFSLILNSTLSFNQDVGANKNLDRFSIVNSSGTILKLNTSQFITNGRQSWTENVILNSPTGTVTLENTNNNTSRFIGIGASGKVVRSADGNPNSLVVLSNGGVRFNGDIGDDIFPIVSLSVTSVADIRISGSIKTTTGQEFNGNILMANDSVFSGSSIDIKNNGDNGGFDLTIDNTDGVIASSIAGVLSGAGDLIKTGAGDLGITSQTSMTGNVFLNEGSLTNNSLANDLLVNSPVITLAKNTTANLGIGIFSEVDLTNGQILKGGGYCNCVINVLGGVVAPGLNSGQMTRQLSMIYMEMSEFSTLEIELNGTTADESYDQINVEGANLTDSTLNLSLGFAPDIGDSFTIIKVNGPPPVIGTFVGSSEGDTIIVNDRILSISYNGGDSNDVELTVVGATRYYVDENAAAGNDGLSWNTAFNTLQDALAVAISGEIWVAAGVYYPDEGGSQTDNDRDATFTLIDGVSLYGGFDGTETTLNQSNPGANVTILSGDIAQLDNSNSNSYHILTGSNVDTGTMFDGFTVTKGNNNKFSGANGVGMFCGNNTSGPSINRVIFSYNKSLNGHGSALFGCTQMVSYSSFINNKISGGSENGNVFATGGVFMHVAFRSNISSNNGGAIFNTTNPITISNSSFMANRSTVKGAAIYTTADISMENTLFSGNHSRSTGGAMYIGAGVTANLINVTMTGNYADASGGAIAMTATSVLNILNSIIWNNDLDDSGNNDPAISIDMPSGAVVNNSYSLIQNFGTTGTSNLDEDPLFVTDSPSPTLSNTPNSLGNARLTELSIAIDTGNNSIVASNFDLDGLQRIRNTTVDIGAYEFFVDDMFKDGFE